MRNPFKSYYFWIKIFSAALLLALGIWLIVDMNTGEKFAVFLVLLFSGLVAGIFAVIRMVPLMRTLKTGKGRLTCIIEIAIHLGLAAAMIFAAIAKVSNESSKFSDFVYEYYRFAIALFLYTRVVSYFICSVLCKEETDKIKFWIHIGLLTLTCVLCAIPFISGKTIAWCIAVLALCCSVCLIVESGMGYNRYRMTISKEREEKKQEKLTDEEEIEAPGDEELIIPMIDEEIEDTIHIN